MIDRTFELNIPLAKKLDLAKQLGSDCAFFIESKPVFAIEKGDVFQPIKIDLSIYYILVVYPNIHSNTKLAYQGVIPKQPQLSIKTIIETKPIDQWKALLVNDFEVSVCKQFPEILELKNKLYASGAVYASMSGSGSAVFGIFKERPSVELKKEYLFFLQEPK